MVKNRVKNLKDLKLQEYKLFMTTNFNFPGKINNIEFGKINAVGRKRYKRKLKPKKAGLLTHKEDRDRVKTGVQVAQEGRRWIHTALSIKRLFN